MTSTQKFPIQEAATPPIEAAVKAASLSAATVPEGAAADKQTEWVSGEYSWSDFLHFYSIIYPLGIFFLNYLLGIL